LDAAHVLPSRRGVAAQSKIFAAARECQAFCGDVGGIHFKTAGYEPMNFVCEAASASLIIRRPSLRNMGSRRGATRGSRSSVGAAGRESPVRSEKGVRAMYSGSIIDAHTHLWDLSMDKHPWLRAANDSVAALGGLDKIRHNFVVEDYLRDSAGQGVVASVHIEARWDFGDRLGETRWLERLDKSSGVALRYIASAPFGAPDAAEILEQQASFPRVVGVRDLLSFHPTNPAKNFAVRGDIADDPAWRADVARLIPLKLMLELMMYPYQLAGVIGLARSLPDLQIVLNHCASPIDRDEEGMRRWRGAVSALSKEPNIAIKVSNIAAYDPRPTYESVRAVALHCLESFGAARTMLATDWPVAKMTNGFAEIYDTFRRITADLTPQEQSALFHDNAKRFYRL
jgi:predicted TIM-barrel fold metal-dependent hydrolase